MAPPPPILNGILSNGTAKPANIITPQNNHAGLLKEIETGKQVFFLLMALNGTK